MDVDAQNVEVLEQHALRAYGDAGQADEFFKKLWRLGKTSRLGFLFSKEEIRRARANVVQALQSRKPRPLNRRGPEVIVQFIMQRFDSMSTAAKFFYFLHKTVGESNQLGLLFSTKDITEARSYATATFEEKSVRAARSRRKSGAEASPAKAADASAKGAKPNGVEIVVQAVLKECNDRAKAEALLDTLGSGRKLKAIGRSLSQEEVTEAWLRCMSSFDDMDSLEAEPAAPGESREDRQRRRQEDKERRRNRRKETDDDREPVDLIVQHVLRECDRREQAEALLEKLQGGGRLKALGRSFSTEEVTEAWLRCMVAYDEQEMLERETGAPGVSGAAGDDSDADAAGLDSDDELHMSGEEDVDQDEPEVMGMSHEELLRDLITSADAISQEKEVADDQADYPAHAWEAGKDVLPGSEGFNARATAAMRIATFNVRLDSARQVAPGDMLRVSGDRDEVLKASRQASIPAEASAPMEATEAQQNPAPEASIPAEASAPMEVTEVQQNLATEASIPAEASAPMEATEAQQNPAPEAGISQESDAKLTASLSQLVRVLAVDLNANRVQCTVPEVGDVWFAAVSLFKKASPPEGEVLCPPLQPHQESVAFLIHPKSPCTRLLVDHATGSGKTREMIRALDNHFYDLRPKIPIFPRDAVCRNFYAELLRWPNRYRDYFSCMCPQDAAIASSCEDWKKRRNAMWDMSGFTSKELKRLCLSIREVLEMKRMAYMGMMRRSFRKAFRKKHPGEPMPLSPLRAISYTSAGGCFSQIAGKAELPLSALMKIGYEHKCGNVYTNKVVLLDEAHNLCRTQTQYSAQLDHLRTLLVAARKSVLVGFTGTPILSEPKEGQQLLAIIRGPGNYTCDEGFMSSFTVRPRSVYPLSLPIGVPDSMLTQQCVRQLVKRIELRGDTLKMYDTKRHLGFQGLRLRSYCNIKSYFASFHDNKGGNKSKILANPEECCPKLHSAAQAVLSSHLKTLIIIGKSSGCAVMAEVLRKYSGGHFGVATLDELSEFNHVSNLRGERFRVLVADAAQCSEGVSFLGVRRTFMVDAPMSHSQFVQQCGRAIRMYSHRGLPLEEQTVTNRIYVSVLPSWMRSSLACFAYRAQRSATAPGEGMEKRARLLTAHFRRVGIDTVEELKALLDEQCGGIPPEALTSNVFADFLEANKLWEDALLVRGRNKKVAAAATMLRGDADDESMIPDHPDDSAAAAAAAAAAAKMPRLRGLAQALRDLLLAPSVAAAAATLSPQTVDEEFLQHLAAHAAEVVPALASLRKHAIDREVFAAFGEEAGSAEDAGIVMEELSGPEDNDEDMFDELIGETPVGTEEMEQEHAKGCCCSSCRAAKSKSGAGKKAAAGGGATATQKAAAEEDAAFAAILAAAGKKADEAAACVEAQPATSQTENGEGRGRGRGRGRSAKAQGNVQEKEMEAMVAMAHLEAKEMAAKEMEAMAQLRTQMEAKVAVQVEAQVVPKQQKRGQEVVPEVKPPPATSGGHRMPRAKKNPVKDVAIPEARPPPAASSRALASPRAGRAQGAEVVPAAPSDLFGPRAPQQSPFKRVRLRAKSADNFGGPAFAAAAALGAAVATALPEAQLPQETSVWIYTGTAGIAVRSGPAIDGPRVDSALVPGETFDVSEERRGDDEVTFLKLADGRGWLFDKKPGKGTMCVRQAPEAAQLPEVVADDDAFDELIGASQTSRAKATASPAKRAFAAGGDVVEKPVRRVRLRAKSAAAAGA